MAVDAARSKAPSSPRKTERSRVNIRFVGHGRFPNEITLMILEFALPERRPWSRAVPYPYSRGFFATACLVSHGWRHYARPLLYHDVVLQDYVSCALFARSLTQNRSLRTLVRSVSLPYRQTIASSDPILYRRQKLMSRKAALSVIHKKCTGVVRLCGGIEDLEPHELLFGKGEPLSVYRGRVEQLELQRGVDQAPLTIVRRRRIPAPPDFKSLDRLTLQSGTVTEFPLLAWMPVLRVLVLLGQPVPEESLSEFLGHAPASLRILHIAHTKFPASDELSSMLPNCRSVLEELTIYNCLVTVIGDLSEFRQLRVFSITWPVVGLLHRLPPALEDLSIATPSSASVPQLTILPDWPPFVQSRADLEAAVRRVQRLNSGLLEHCAESAPLLQRITITDDSGLIADALHAEVMAQWKSSCEDLRLRCSIVVG